jgi:hypothetical protein
MAFRTVAILMVGDFKERVRRYSFLVTMVAAVYLGYSIIAGNIVITLDKYRGIYDSAWIGTLVAQSSTVFISLVGFYVVKNAISWDRQSRVGQIIAATRVNKFFYLVGKSLSNFGILSAAVLIQAVAAVVMVLLSKDSKDVNLANLLLPFFFITLPAIAFVAALAVMFESIKILRGGFGNVIFFMLLQMTIVFALEVKSPWLDLWCLQDVQQSMQSDLIAVHPEYNGGFSLNTAPWKEADKIITFKWNGLDYSPAFVVKRMSWFAFAFVAVLIATLFFNRFNESPSIKRKRQWLRRNLGENDQASDENGLATPVVSGGVLKTRSRFLLLLVAEVRLMFKGVHSIWYIVALGLNIASIFAPSEVVINFILPFTWIWPVLLWSKMGMREIFYDTDQLIFSAPGIVPRQFIAVWSSGVILTLLTGFGAGLHYAASGDLPGLAGLAVAVLFIPSFALVSGIWSKGSKLFEAAYSIWWYIGPMNRTPEFDFIGGSSTTGIRVIYLVISVFFLVLAYIGRKRQSVGS